MSASFPTNCLTGWRMHFSWLPMESMFSRSFISSTLFHYINIMSCFTFSNAEDKQQNPMVQLFYGTFVTERKHEGMSLFTSCCWRHSVWSVLHHSHLWLYLGKTLCNIEQFGQYPLQVNGFSNLDECLEGAMVEKEIESLHSDHSITSGREVNRLTVDVLSSLSLLCLCN